MDGPQRHIDAARTRLTHLAGLAEHTQAADRKILDAAQDRLSIVTADLDKLRGRVMLDDAAADQYLAGVSESGQLKICIARAQQQLAGEPE